MAKKEFTEQTIVDLLATRHSKDVFVPQCNNGPTGDGHRRMDAWAMAKSWAKPTTWAYEVKISRSDFLRDDKFHDYLDCCNQFSFVCPRELIAPDELPPEVGLIWVSKTGKKLFTKKKAVHRDVQVPESVFRYILMARATIGRSNFYESGNKKYFHDWLEHRRLDYDFGRRVSRAIAERVKREIDDVSRLNKQLERRMATYDNVIERLQELGFDPDSPIAEWKVNKTLRELKDGLPAGFQDDLSKTIGHLTKLKEAIGS